MPQLRTVGLSIGTAAFGVIALASPASAHAGDDVPDVTRIDLTAGPFEVVLSLDDEENGLFLVEVLLTSESGAVADGVELRWVDESGVVQTTPAVAAADGDALFEATVGQTADHRLDLTVLITATDGALVSVLFSTDVESPPPWVDVVVLVTALWTLPFALWLVSRFPRTWLRPIRWDHSQLDRYLVPPTPEIP
jgi:hypothetical protein